GERADELTDLCDTHTRFWALRRPWIMVFVTAGTAGFLSVENKGCTHELASDHHSYTNTHSHTHSHTHTHTHTHTFSHNRCFPNPPQLPSCFCGSRNGVRRFGGIRRKMRRE